MLRDLFKRIADFFRSLFGNTGEEPTPKPDPIPTPPPVPPTPPPTPPPVIDLDTLSDASEIFDLDSITVSLPDTLIVIEGPAEEEQPIIDPPVVVPENPPRYMWCLDNGHGKLTAGKRSPVFDDGTTQLLEYEFNRDVVERIIARLEEEGVSYADLVPDVDDLGNALETRVGRANQLSTDLPKLYLSVHSNAGPADDTGWTFDSVNGIETWYYYGSVTGKKMASIFQQALFEEMGWKNRGLKTSKASPFYVLKKTLMPAILTENGFFNNKAQALDLMKDSIRQQIAEAHVNAILKIEAEGF